MTVGSRLVRARLAGALVAALVVLGGCADATSLADTTSDDPTAEAPDEPASEPTAEPTEAPVQPATRPRRGACVSLRVNDVLYDVLRAIPESVPCAQRHAGQLTDVQPLSPEMRRAVMSGRLGPVADRLQSRCRRSTTGWLGTDAEGLVISQFFSLPALPTYERLRAGADWFTCITYAIRQGTSLLVLPRDTRRILADDTDSPYGTCVRGAISGAGDDRVVCSLKHRWRAVAAVRLGGPGASFDGENRVRERVRGACETQVRDYLDTTKTYQYGYTWPTRPLWRDGDRFGVCYAQVRV